MSTASAIPVSDLADWPVAILAGGLARRLRPLTETIPKALVPVAGAPFIAHQFRLLHAQGFRRAVLCVGFLGEMIEGEFGDGSDFGMQLAYSFDGPQLLGTGGALRRALPLLGRRFLVLYGDSYLPTNYGAAVQAFLASRQPALMTVFHNQGRWDTSNVVFAHGMIHCYDKKRRRPKMDHIDYGLGILEAEVLARRAPEEVFDLSDIYHELSVAGQLAGYEVHQRFYEIGSPDGLSELDTLLKHQL